MAFTLTKIQPYSSAQLLFAPTANNAFSDNHSPKTAEPSPSLNPHSVMSHFLQLERHPSLPPRPPPVVPTSTIERIDYHSQCPNDFDTAFSDLVPATRGMKASDRESSICASVKDYSNHKHSDTALPAQGSLYSTTAIAAYADLTPPSTREQSQSPGSSAENRATPDRRSQCSHESQTSSLSPFTIRDHSVSALDGCNSHLSEREASGSITSEESSPNNMVALPIGDVILSGKAAHLSPRLSRTESSGGYLRRNNHTLAKRPSVAPESEDLGSDNEDSKAASNTDDEQDSGDRWEYHRIVARRIDSSGRRMAKVEWKNTWEPEEELNGLKRALRRYAKERRETQNPATCLNCRAKKRKYAA